jgi:hypothetical protein
MKIDIFTDEHYGELTSVDRERLAEAASGIDAGFGAANPGVLRYVFYRRKGYTPEGALSFAMAWAHNAVEQKRRRLSHETGAEDWRPVR